MEAYDRYAFVDLKLILTIETGTYIFICKRLRWNIGAFQLCVIYRVKNNCHRLAKNAEWKPERKISDADENAKWYVSEIDPK